MLPYSLSPTPREPCRWGEKKEEKKKETILAPTTMRPCLLPPSVSVLGNLAESPDRGAGASVYVALVALDMAIDATA